MNKPYVCRLMVNNITKNSVDIDCEQLLNFSAMFDSNLNENYSGLQVGFDDVEGYDAVSDELIIASKHLLRAFKIIGKYNRG